MAYNKDDVAAAGVALADLVDAAVEDGFSVTDDANEVINLITALAGAFDDVAGGNAKVALFHLFGAAFSKYGDEMLDDAVDPVV